MLNLRGSFCACRPGVIPVSTIVSALEFSVTVTLPIGSSVGGWRGSTVTVKYCVVMLLVLVPLFTVTVIIAVPVPEALGRRLNTPELDGLL